MTRINLIPQREYLRISCSWRDSGLRTWAFEIFNGPDRWAIDADTVTLECSNGTEIACTIEDNTVIAECTDELAAAPGNYMCKLVFRKDDMQLSTQAFRLWVEGL